MTITIRPTDDYQEYKFSNYHDVDQLLMDCYPHTTDIMDVEIYEGTVVDNYIGYAPKLPMDELKTATLVKAASQKQVQYNYVVVLETFENEWTSSQRVIFTNDDHFVDQVYEYLSKDD